MCISLQCGGGGVVSKIRIQRKDFAPYGSVQKFRILANPNLQHCSNNNCCKLVGFREAGCTSVQSIASSKEARYCA